MSDTTARNTKAPEVEALAAAPGGGVPNHPAWPALVYRGAVDGGRGTGPIKALLASNGWAGLWEWSVFDYHHFHPDAAEVLVVARGRAVLQLGGPEGPLVPVAAGDVLILPAGFGHRLDGSEDGFLVVGGYPEGQTGKSTWRPDAQRMADWTRQIAQVPRPAADPVFGAGGPLLQAWAADPAAPEG
jgi:uncharacterized protein YjlB